MYVTTLDAFISESERIFSENPTKTRFSVKYRHSNGFILLKVTDNATVVSYKTRELNDVKDIEKLTNAFLHHFATLKTTGAPAAMEVEGESQRGPRQSKKKGKKEGKKK